MQDIDILIAGGGVAGLTAAAAFGAAGFSVVCADPAPPITQADTDGADLRSTAFLQPARALLDRAGLWSRLEPFGAALRTMRIIDADATGPRVTRDFNASDISDAPFGWNLPNWLIRREILARLADLPAVDFRPGTAVTGVTARASAALVTLSDGSRITARLLIAADGRDSFVRRALGIGTHVTRSGQKALAFAVTHPIPHDGISTEIHRSGGPFTLVPLPDRDGRPASAVVWMDHGAATLARVDAPIADFEAEMNARSCHVQGPLTLASRRTLWPIIGQTATRMTAARTALVAEAAHVLPPIGAQGLNMSLADIATLLDLAEADRAGLGSVAMLAAYQRARHAEVLARSSGIGVLNRISMLGGPLASLRGPGLRLLHDVAPLRRALMKAGLNL